LAPGHHLSSHVAAVADHQRYWFAVTDIVGDVIRQLGHLPSMASHSRLEKSVSEPSIVASLFSQPNGSSTTRTISTAP
jgi:hypothetical protein